MFSVLRGSGTNSSKTADGADIPHESLIEAVIQRLKNDFIVQQLLSNTVLVNHAPCPGIFDLLLRMIRHQLSVASSSNNNNNTTATASSQALSGKKRRLHERKVTINNYKPNRSSTAIISGFSPFPATQLGFEGAKQAGVEGMVQNSVIFRGRVTNDQVHIKVNKVATLPDGRLAHDKPSKHFNPDTDKRSTEFYDGSMFEIIEKNALVRDVSYQDRLSRMSHEKPVNVVLVAADKRISSHWLRTKEFVAVICKFIQKLHHNSRKNNNNNNNNANGDTSSMSSTRGASSLVSIEDVKHWTQVPTFLLRALAYIGAVTVVFPRLTTTSTRTERILFGQPARFYEIVNPFRLRLFTEELELMYQNGGGSGNNAAGTTTNDKSISVAWARSMAAVENQSHLHGRQRQQRRGQHTASSSSSSASHLRSSSDDVSSISHTWHDQVMPATTAEHNDDEHQASYAFDALCFSAAVYTVIGTHYARDAQHTRVLYSHFYRQWRNLCTRETLNEIKSRDNSEYSRQMEKRLLNIGKMLFRDNDDSGTSSSASLGERSDDDDGLVEFDDMIDNDETRREFFRRIRMYKNVYKHIHPTLQIYHHQASRTPSIQQVHELDGVILYNLLILYERSGELWKLYDATGAPDIFALIERQKQRDAKVNDNDDDESSSESSSSSSSSRTFDWYEWDAEWAVIAFMERPSSLSILTTIEDLSKRRRVEWRELFQPGTWFVINPMEVITAFANTTGNSKADDYLRQFHKRCESRMGVLRDSTAHAGRITLDQMIQSPILVCLRRDWEYIQTVCTPVLCANPRTNRFDAAPLHPMLLAKFYHGSSVNLQAFILSMANFIDRHRSYSEKQQKNDPQKHVPLFDPTKRVPSILAESKERNHYERQFNLHVDKTLWIPVLEAQFRTFLPVIMNRCEDEYLMKDLLWQSFRRHDPQQQQQQNKKSSGRLRYYSSSRGENFLSALRAFLSLQERHYLSRGALQMLVNKFLNQGRTSIALQLALPHHFQLVLFLQDATDNLENVKHHLDGGERIPVPAAYPVVGGRKFYYADGYDDYDVVERAVWADMQLPRYDFPLWMLLYHLCCIDNVEVSSADVDRRVRRNVKLHVETLEDLIREQEQGEGADIDVRPPTSNTTGDEDWESFEVMSNADAIALFVGLSLSRLEVNVPGSALYNSPSKERVQEQHLPLELCYVKRVMIEDGRLAEAEHVDWSQFYVDDERQRLMEKFHIDPAARPSKLTSTAKKTQEKQDVAVGPRVTLTSVQKYELHRRALNQFTQFFGEKSGRSFPMARPLDVSAIGPGSSDRFMVRSDEDRERETYPGLFAMETMLRLLEEMHNFPQMLAQQQETTQPSSDFRDWGARWKFTREEILQLVQCDRDYPLRIFARDGKALYSRDLFPVMSSDVLMSNDTAHKDATRDLCAHEKLYKEVRPFDGSELGFIETLYLMPLDYLLDDRDE